MGQGGRQGLRVGLGTSESGGGGQAFGVSGRADVACRRVGGRAREAVRCIEWGPLCRLGGAAAPEWPRVN